IYSTGPTKTTSALASLTPARSLSLSLYISVKIIRNKLTGQPEGYGFVEFVSHQAAERILQTYNGTQMPGTELTFRLNWASFGTGERRPDAGPEHSIFVGDLAPDVTDLLLQETFRTQYMTVRGAKVVTDPNTGRSKGYGFVKFGDENERNRAMSEMNGVYCSTRPMRISAATPKKTTGYQQQYPAAAAVYPAPTYATPVQVVSAADNDPTNTTWSAYYGYGQQGYDAYGYGAAAQDPSLYAYAGYTGYPQQGVQDMTGGVPMVEQREEIYDPLAAPDVDK
ncbi:Polyadenylate-binding protein RBP47B', partial [Linum perenne]